MTIFLISYNDSKILPFSISHYKLRYPGSRIVIYDNFSSDNTAQIANKFGCELKQFYTHNRMDDQAVINVKNNCWKGVHGWVIVADVDELLHIEADFINEDATVYDGEVIDVIGGLRSNKGIVYDHHPSKMACFNADKIQEMNYGFGCHEAYPFGEVRISKDAKIYHYKYLSAEHIIERNKEAGARLSERNKKLGLSFHYKFGMRKIRKVYKSLERKVNVSL